MQKNLYIFNFKKWPIAFVIVIFMIIATEIFVRVNFVYIAPPFDNLVYYKYNYLAKNINKYNVLLFGDSRSTFFDAKRLSDLLTETEKGNYQAYNLTFHHSDIRSYYLLLKKYLKKNEAPRMLFFCGMPEALFDGWNLKNSNPSDSAYWHRFFLKFAFFETIEVFPMKIQASTIIPRTENMLKLLEYRKYIKSLFNVSILRQHIVNTHQFLKILNVAESNNGGGLMMVPDENKKGDPLGNLLLNPGNKIDDDAVFWFKRFLSLANKNNIEVVVFNLPLKENLDRINEKNDFKKKYNLLLSNIANEFDNVKLLQPLIVDFPSEYFFDSNHLNESGIYKFYDEFFPSLTKLIEENK